mmetsp:Transcript_1699/g.3621  ORF Transcript_1699/g.3621 Transcript_1699/m.3621 type:complete len:97 (-) Transcript_1699:88-378(-)
MPKPRNNESDGINSTRLMQSEIKADEMRHYSISAHSQLVYSSHFHKMTLEQNKHVTSQTSCHFGTVVNGHLMPSRLTMTLWLMCALSTNLSNGIVP